MEQKSRGALASRYLAVPAKAIGGPASEVAIVGLEEQTQMAREIALLIFR